MPPLVSRLDDVVRRDLSLLRRNVDRATVATLVLADVVIALVWLVGGDARTAAPAYDAALALLPIQTYGALLLTLVAAVGVLRLWTPAATTVAWAALGAFWAWWAALTTLVAVMSEDASAYFPASAAVLAVVHTGTALTRED